MTQKFGLLYDLLVKQEPEQSDIVVWLQGDRFDRAKKTLELFRQKWASKIVISGNDILIGEGKRPGENNVSLKEMRAWLLDRGVKKQDIIIDDGALNTKDQAQHVIAMAITNNWKRIIIVGSSYYQPRAFLTFLKQLQIIGNNISVINQFVILGKNDIPSGRNITAEYLIKDEIKKIEKYHNDVATINDGIKYLSDKTYDNKFARG